MVETQTTIKQIVLDQIQQLEAEWVKLANDEDRTKPVDYLRVGEVQGGINALMRLLVLLDNTK